MGIVLHSDLQQLKKSCVRDDKSSSSSSTFQAISLGFTIMGEILVIVALFFFFFFFYQTVGVVTVCLHGWCMLSVFLLPTFIHLGHLLHSLAMSLRFTIFDEIFSYVTVIQPLR